MIILYINDEKKSFVTDPSIKKKHSSLRWSQWQIALVRFLIIFKLMLWNCIDIKLMFRKNVWPCIHKQTKLNVSQSVLQHWLQRCRTAVSLATFCKNFPKRHHWQYQFNRMDGIWQWIASHNSIRPSCTLAVNFSLPQTATVSTSIWIKRRQPTHFYHLLSFFPRWIVVKKRRE